MQFVTLAAGILLLAGNGLAGRAFPSASVRYIEDAFSRLNRNIQWDYTNFLVDLSGRYAQCSADRSGRTQVSERTPQNQEIGILLDFVSGSGVDVDSANAYIKRVVDRWLTNDANRQQVTKATRFGCSVEPGCPGGQAVVACLFTPKYGQGQKEEKGKQNGYAFSDKHYDLVEKATGKKWDHTRFLENLSGYETDCSMIGKSTWTFALAKRIAASHKKRVQGFFGWYDNRYGTTVAIRNILNTMKEQVPAQKVGCSVIPKCSVNRRNYAVVSCLFELL